MNDSSVMRRYTFKLYPNAAQTAALDEQAKMMVDLWNALLQRREDVYRRERRTLTFFDMTAEITQLRQACPEWAALSVWSAHRVAESLDNAFKAFFRRAKAGAGRQSGYPRFRRRALGNAVPHRCASGCKLLPIANESSDVVTNRASARNWRLTLKGVTGPIRTRGEFPSAPLAWKHADVIFRDGSWWFSVCVTLAPRRVPGTAALTIRLDLVDEFARIERAEGPRRAPEGSARAPAESPNHLNIIVGAPDSDESAGSDERELLRQGVRNFVEPDSDESAGLFVRIARLTERADVIKATRDIRFRKWSRRWRRETGRAQRLTGKAARVRREFLHRFTTSATALACDLTVISPTVKDLTTSPRGDTKNWGAAVETVSALNRNTLNQAPAMAVQMLAYKAAEAGIRCDVVEDDMPAIEIGRDLTTGTKAVRRLRREIRKAA